MAAASAAGVALPAPASPLTPSARPTRCPPAGVATTGVARRQRLQHDVRQAVDVAGVVAHRRHDGDVGGRQAARRRRPATVFPEESTRSATPAARAVRGARRRGRRRRPGPDEARDGAAQRGDGVDQVLESLLAHEAPGGEHDLGVAAGTPSARARRARRRRRAEARRSTPYGTVSMRPASAPSAIARACAGRRCTR